MAPKASDPARRCAAGEPVGSGSRTWAPTSPLELIGAKLEAGIAAPSSVMTPAAAGGATTFTKFGLNSVPGAQNPVLFQQPTNILSIEQVANSLELLGKSLPKA